MKMYKTMTKNRMLRVVLFISLFYLFLSSGNFFSISTLATADDYLQFQQATSLTKGEWLGNYNFLTLSKGISYPAWIAFLHSADIPLWLGNALLYMVACLAIIYVLRRVIPNRLILIFIYTFILFNPIVIPRTYRDVIAPAVGLFLIAWAIGIFLLHVSKDLEKGKSIKEWTLLTIIGTIFLPVWVFLREDYIWLIPFISIPLGSSLILLAYRACKSKQSIRVLLVSSLSIFLPIMTVYMAGVGIAHLNKQHYGRAVINDFVSDDFEGAYGALSRVIGDDYNNKPLTVPVSESSRQKIYAVSPAFRELHDCIDSVNGSSACEALKKYGDISIHDYEGGWFVWALRVAVQEKGYYKNASTARDYYVRLSSEINQACEDGRLQCTPKRSTLAPVFSKRYIEPTVGDTLKTLLFVIRLDFPGAGTFKAWSASTPVQDEMAHYLNARYSSQDLNMGVRAKHKAQKVIYKTYRALNSILFAVSIAILALATMMIKRFKKYWREIFITWCLLFAICFRVAMIAYVDTTSFKAISNNYLSSVYPIMLLFEAVVLGVAGTFLYRREKRKLSISE